MSDDISAPSAAAPSAAPVSTDATPVQPASAIVTPAPSGDTTGEPPKERWADILANARTKERATVDQEYRQKYGWADEAQRDPWGFTQAQLDRMASHPDYEKQVLAYAARLLNSRRGREAPKIEEPAADVPVVDQHGNIVSYTYSDKALKALQGYQRQQIDETIASRLGPIEARLAQADQAAATAQIEVASRTHASRVLAELETQPYFKEHKAEIAKVFGEHPEWGDNVHRAYLHVFLTRVLPTLTQTQTKHVLDDLQTKAAAGSITPGSQTAAHAPQFRTGDFEKDARAALKYYAEHPDEAEAMAHR